MPSSTPTSFPLFPLLPAELRLQIWRSVPYPRVVTLSYLPLHMPSSGRHTVAGNDTSSNNYTYYTPNTRPPTLLHVCHESRAEGMRIYTQCYLPTITSSSDSEQQDDKTGLEEQKRRYFHLHPHLDILYLPRPSPSPGAARFDPAGAGYAAWAREFASSSSSSYGVPAAAAVVRRIALDYVPAEVRRPWEVYGKLCLLRGCPMLEEVFLVVSGSSSASAPSSSSSSLSSWSSSSSSSGTRSSLSLAGGSGSAVIGSGPGTDDIGEGEGGAEAVERGVQSSLGLGIGVRMEMDMPGQQRLLVEWEFVDPRWEPGEIMGIMERVRESFRHEGGVEMGADFGLGAARRGEGEGDENHRGKDKSEKGMELTFIPKAKKRVMRQWGCRVGYVSCAGSGVGVVV